MALNGSSCDSMSNEGVERSNGGFWSCNGWFWDSKGIRRYSKVRRVFEGYSKGGRRIGIGIGIWIRLGSGSESFCLNNGRYFLSANVVVFFNNVLYVFEQFTLCFCTIYFICFYIIYFICFWII